MKTSQYRPAFLILGLLSAIVGCGSRAAQWDQELPQAGSSASLCEPGVTRECTGPGACRGGQQCSAQGQWGACDCGTAKGGSGPAGGAGGLSAGGSTFASAGRSNVGNAGTAGIAGWNRAGNAGYGSAGKAGAPPSGGGNTNKGGAGGSSAGGTKAGGAGGTSAGGTTTQYQGGTSYGGTSYGGTNYGGSTIYGGTTSYGGTNYGGSTIYGGTTSYGGTGIGGASTTAPNEPPAILDLYFGNSRVWTNDTVWAYVKAMDPNGDKIGFSYAWTVNGQPAGNSSASLSGAYFSKGDEIRVTVTPSDGKVSGTAVTSGALIVENSSPAFYSSPYVDPGDVADDDATLTCTVGSASAGYDPDGDSVTYSYIWYRDSEKTTHTGESLPATATTTGEYWYCEIVASDGTLSNSAMSNGTWIATRVGGIMRTDTTWVAAKSPYYFVERLQIAKGVTLKVEPGVQVLGNYNSLETWGSISMLGTKEKPIFVDYLALSDNSTETSPAKIELSFVQYTGGSLLSWSQSGSSHISDCVIQYLDQFITLSGAPAAAPTNSHVFERNVFRQSSGIQSTAPLKVINNVFVDMYDYTCISAQDSLVANLNSFLNQTQSAVVLGAKSADVRNNYWGGITDAEVPDLIFDNNDDLNIAGTADYLPTLASPDPSTPAPDKVYVQP